MLVLGGIVLIVVLALVIFVVSTKNRITKADNRVEEAYSTMDVYLKKRHDLIPNLVNIVKGYTKYEGNTLEEISKANSIAATSANFNQKVDQEQILDNAANRITAIAQAYPELKANTTFVNLMDQLKSVENDITNARKYYNASVREYNNLISTFPGSLFAKDDQKKPYFQVTSEAERENVNVTF